MILRILATVALLVLIGGSLLLSRQQHEVGTPAPANRPAEDLGYGARDAQLIETGADGRPRYTVNAKLIEQHPKDDSVQLQVVHMILDDVDGNRWTIDAQRGDIGPGGEKIELSGDVHAAGMLPGTDQPADISSEQLSFDTRTDIVSTQEPVMLAWTGRQIHSVRHWQNLIGRGVVL